MRKIQRIGLLVILFLIIFAGSIFITSLLDGNLQEATMALGGSLCGWVLSWIIFIELANKEVE